MSEILVTSAQLRAKAEELMSANTQFKTQVEDLEAKETSLMGMWDGDAKDQFHKAFSSDKIQMTNFFNAIARYAEVLEDIAQQYDTAEARNVDIANTRNYK